MKRKLLVTVACSGLLAMCLSTLPLGAAATASMVDAEPAISALSMDAVAAEPRVLFNDEFEANDGAKWLASKANDAASISFAGGMASIKGSGPENRILSQADILSKNFTLGADLFINPANTNSAIKLGFFASASAASRYQLTFDGPKQLVRLERVDGAGTTVLGSPASTQLAVNGGGAPHKVSLEVAGNTVRASVNGALVLTVPDAGTATARQGRILVASQFPNQDFSVDNIRVTTTAAEAAAEYTVALATETNQVLDTTPATAGGTLTANRSSGNLGDVVTLSYTVHPGFIFAGYESKRADTNTGTDGLLTIEDNRFAFNDKTGSVVIIAKFVTEPADPNIIFQDRFTGTLNDHGQYSLSAPNALSVTDGQLVITPTQGAAHALVDGATWADPLDYTVALDARKTNGTAGTVQIAFRAGGFSNRYVLALNGSKAMLRRIDSAGGNVELASALYTFDQTARSILIDVSGATVSVSSNGTPLLSYVNRDDAGRDAADWSGLAPALALINMTPSAPAAFDNVVVSRKPVYVKATVEVSNAGLPDPDRNSGAVVLNEYKTSAGSVLEWTSYPKGGYAFTGMSFNGQPLVGGQFLVPEGTSSDLTLVANFAPQTTSATTYYVDAVAGNDANAGTSTELPWASLSKLKRNFHPGDKILLKRGSVFAGAAAALQFSGSGTAQHPIAVGAYGEGPRPRLNGGGEVENVVALHNQEYITISGLEITNLVPRFDSRFGLNTSNNREKNLRAVNVSAQDFAVLRGISITDLYIHNINGNLNSKWNGGIFFNVAGSIVDGEILGVPTKFDEVLIEGNKFERVDRSGIKLVDSVWANQSLTNSPNTPLNWYPSTNVVVRENQFRQVGGDAITVRDTDGTLVEYNLVRHARYQNTGYNAGIWPFQSTNSVIQYNEVSNTHGVQDGQGLDLDHVSANSVMQYNYSHNNEGGFMLIMNGFPHTAPTIRYNISQNDADKTFEFSRGTAAGTMIYNNTIYSASTLQGPRGGVLDLANSGAGTGNREVFIFNNVFHYPAGQAFYVGEAAAMKTKAKLLNNAYAGGISVPTEEERAITGELGLPGVGTAPVDNASSTVPLAGVHAGQHFAGYTPAEHSVLRNAGLSLEEVVDHYGGTVTDRSEMSPTQIHALARQAPSIDFVAGRNMPALLNVRYDVDFLGNPILGAATAAARTAAEGLSVGAVQYRAEVADPEPSGPAEPTPSAAPTVEAPEPTATSEPSAEPTPAPSSVPTLEPTPSAAPTVEAPAPTATLEPSAAPSSEPTPAPTPSAAPTVEAPEPTLEPSSEPTLEPTLEPTRSAAPTAGSPAPTVDPVPATDASSSPATPTLPGSGAPGGPLGGGVARPADGAAATTDRPVAAVPGAAAAEQDELASTGVHSIMGLSLVLLASLLLIAGGVLRRSGKRA